jgi:hypothetical protein
MKTIVGLLLLLIGCVVMYDLGQATGRALGL